MELQDIFTKVKNHLLQQNAQSMGNDGCNYRGEDNNRCAVGFLIPDNIYNSDIEGYGVDCFYKAYKSENTMAPKSKIPSLAKVAEFLNLQDRPTRNLLNGLQYIHDEYTPDQWEYELESLAKRHSLEYDEAAPTVEELNKTLPAKETQPCT